MKIKMPFCANMNTGVPWDSGLPFLRALGPAHNRLKTTAGCFVPFEFCTDKNRSDIKCDSVSLEVVAPLDGSRFTVSACFLSFMLSFIISANTSCHIRSMNMRAFSFFSFKTDETTFPRADTNTTEECFFSVSCTSSLEDVAQSQLSGSTETQFTITGCLKWYQACYAVTHTDKKNKTVLFLNIGTNSTTLDRWICPPEEKNIYRAWILWPARR